MKEIYTRGSTALELIWRLSTTQEARERAGSAGLRVGSELGHTHSSPPLAALFPGARYPK